MPIPVNQITHAEIVMRGVAAAGGSDAKNINLVFHFRRVAVVIAPTKAALEGTFNGAIAAPILAALNARYTQTFTDTRWVNDAQDPYTSVVRAGVGAIAGDSLSTDQSAYLLHRTALRGRSFRGSKHLAPMSESDVGDDIWNAGCLARLATVNTALLTPLVDGTGNTWLYTIISRKISQTVVNPTTLFWVDVNQALVNKRIGTMLRRKVKSTY